jgi:hypothetical protein
MVGRSVIKYFLLPQSGNPSTRGSDTLNNTIGYGGTFDSLGGLNIT